MITLLSALTLAQALNEMNEIEQAMTDCALGVDHYCQQLTTDQYESSLNELVIFQQHFRPQNDAEYDEWNEALRNLQNATDDANRILRP